MIIYSTSIYIRTVPVTRTLKSEKKKKSQSKCDASAPNDCHKTRHMYNSLTNECGDKNRKKKNLSSLFAAVGLTCGSYGYLSVFIRIVPIWVQSECVELMDVGADGHGPLAGSNKAFGAYNDILLLYECIACTILCIVTTRRSWLGIPNAVFIFVFFSAAAAEDFRGYTCGRRKIRTVRIEMKTRGIQRVRFERAVIVVLFFFFFFLDGRSVTDSAASGHIFRK